jgi:hypothetical protein
MPSFRAIRFDVIDPPAQVGWLRQECEDLSLPPLSTRKVGLKLTSPGVAAADRSNVEAALTLARTGSESGPPIDAAKLVLRVRSAAQARKVTFRSGIDGSVQYYGLVAAAKGDCGGARPGLILTLHGVAVEGTFPPEPSLIPRSSSSLRASV